MNVLLVRDVPEERRFSMERFADELTAGLRASRPEIGVRPLALHQSQRAVRAGLGRLDGYLLRFARYPLAAARQQADVFHIVDQGYAHVAALLPPESTVVTCHDLMLLAAEDGQAGFRGTRTSRVRFRWSVSYLRRAARVVCVSRSTADDVVLRCGVAPERIRVVPNGIAPSFRPLEPAVRERTRAQLAPGGARVLLHVSSGVPYKNVPATLGALAALRSTGVDVLLVRAGVALTDAERALAGGLGVAGAVVECGRVDDERLVELYNAADALVFPSWREGFGWPPLEAMACGTPVVCSDGGGLAEVVGDAALTVAPADVAGLAGALRSVLESPRLADDLRRRGLERAASFSWEQTAAAYAQIYDEVLACAA